MARGCSESSLSHFSLHSLYSFKVLKFISCYFQDSLCPQSNFSSPDSHSSLFGFRCEGQSECNVTVSLPCHDLNCCGRTPRFVSDQVVPVQILNTILKNNQMRDQECFSGKQVNILCFVALAFVNMYFLYVIPDPTPLPSLTLCE